VVAIIAFSCNKEIQSIFSLLLENSTGAELQIFFLGSLQYFVSLFHNPFMKISVENPGQSIYIKNTTHSFFIFLLEGFLLIDASGINGFMKVL